ncbi:cytokinesis protein sepA [Biomphalaria glabrata]|nr:cytokinesis protein sepA [Biomphalaria glabrata]
MDLISKERLREMKEEMERFEMEIQGPGGQSTPSQGFILGANTYDRVQAQLTSLRQETTRLQQQRTQEEREPNTDSFRDEDFRIRNEDFKHGQKRKFHNDEEEENEFHDIDERPGRPQGPLIAPPPPPPPPVQTNRLPPRQGPPLLGDMALVNMFAPPPPPPPEPEEVEESTLSFKPYGPGEGPPVVRPAFMPPQLRHRLPPPGNRPPFPRPPMRMGGPGPFMGPPRPMMGGPGPMAPQRPPMGMQGPMAPPRPPGMEGGGMPFMAPAMEVMAKPTVTEPPKVVYSAAPVITVDIKKDKKKKKKKRLGSEAEEDGEKKSVNQSQLTKESTAGPTAAAAVEDKSVADMEIVPESTLVGGIMAATPASAAPVSTGAPVPGKKEKKKKEKKFIRLAANTVWEDPTLAEWAQDDFRMFCGDLGNEVTDETLVRAFNKYPSFLKAKVVRDRRTNKTKGYGFVSFKDPLDFTRAMREMNGE